VALSREDRARVEAVYLCGPKTADYLEMIGINTFDELATADAAILRLAVNAYLGRPHINAMGVRAFQNLIDAAKAARAQRETGRT
jgi:predicted RecB family nuclease